MAAKPTSLPEWATDETNNDEPSAGQKATGWTPGQDGVSDWDNWYKKLVYDWIQYINDGDLEDDVSITGGDLTMEDGGIELIAGGVVAAGDGEFGGAVSAGGGLNSSGDLQTSLISARPIDSGGVTARQRFTIDHLGFPIGEWSEWTEDWRDGSGLTPPNYWTVGGAGTVTFGGPSELGPTGDSILRTRVARLRCTNALDQADLIGPYIACLSTDVALAVEGQIRTDLTAIDLGDAMRMTWGLQHRHAGADDWYIIFYADPDTDGQWQCRRVGSAGTVDIDSGVNVVTDTVYRFRIEIVGDSLHSGADFLIRWYINGTLVGSVATNSITADDVAPYFSVNCPTNEAGDYDMFVGRVKVAWNHLLSQSEL